MRISIEGLGLRFRQGAEVLRDVNFEVRSGEFVALVGPSGCGKSTTLNLIASLISNEEAEITGVIRVDGVEKNERADWNQRLGYVFQRDTLFPWRTVRQNVETGLEIRGRKKPERQQRAQELINMVG